MPPRPTPTILAPLALAALLLGGCTLVDQRTFQRRAQQPGEGEASRVMAAETPLLTIRMGVPPLGEPTGASIGAAMDRAINIGQDQGGVDFGPPVAEAVRAAQARKPDVVFDIFAVVPTEATPAEQDRRVAQGSADAGRVANAFLAAGVPATRLRLGLRGDPGQPPREVLVFVR